MNIYFCSSLLNSDWDRSGSQSSSLSPWLSAIGTAGFDGIELEDIHFLGASPSEQNLIFRTEVPIKVLKTNIDPAQDPAGFIARAELARRLKAEKLSFNLASILDDPDYIRLVLKRAAVAFREGRLVCGCEPQSAFHLPHQILTLYPDFREAPFDLVLHPFATGPEGLISWLSLFGARVTHADAKIRFQQGQPAPLQENGDSLRTTLRTLRNLNFRGSLSLRPPDKATAVDNNPFALFSIAKSDMDVLRKTWAESRAAETTEHYSFSLC